MILIEQTSDLFENIGKGYMFVHCISADYALGAGIAKVFRDRHNVRNVLYSSYRVNNWSGVGRCEITKTDIIVGNLITKQFYYYKPTYETLSQSLNDLKRQCLQLGITKIAMPRIGCGLDRLNWEQVKNIINKTFSDTGMEVLVCQLN